MGIKFSLHAHTFTYTYLNAIRHSEQFRTFFSKAGGCISEKFCKLDASEEHCGNIRSDHLSPLNYIFHRCLINLLLLLQRDADEFLGVKCYTLRLWKSYHHLKKPGIKILFKDFTNNIKIHQTQHLLFALLTGWVYWDYSATKFSHFEQPLNPGVTLPSLNSVFTTSECQAVLELWYWGGKSISNHHTTDYFGSH